MTDSAENVAGPWRYERLDGPGEGPLDAVGRTGPGGARYCWISCGLSALKAGNRILQ